MHGLQLKRYLHQTPSGKCVVSKELRSLVLSPITSNTKDPHRRKARRYDSNGLLVE